ncbi:MAG: type II toxin-antitoxin system VapC family toxin [Chloroflexota bacterium]
MCAHIVIPADVVSEIDQIVGPRGRSQFVTEAVTEKPRRVHLRQAAHRVVGSLRDVEIPEWETPESTAAWVRASRQKDGARRGLTLSTMDALIAAASVVHGAILVTDDPKDYPMEDVRLLSLRQPDLRAVPD